MDIVFIYSSVVFNISVSALHCATKLGDMVLVQVCGGIVISLMIPFAITLLGSVREKAKKMTVISNEIILVYLSLELLLDYVLRIPFREILAIHVPYIVVFYAVLFSMMGVSFGKNKKMGCLTYYLLPI
jgi:hypothetical protein